MKMFELPRTEYHRIKKDFEIECINNPNLSSTFNTVKDWYKMKTGKTIVTTFKVDQEFYLNTYYYVVSNDEEMTLLTLLLNHNESF